MLKTYQAIFIFIAGMSLQYFTMTDYFDYAHHIVNQIDDCEYDNGRECDYIIAPVHKADPEKYQWRPIS